MYGESGLNLCDASDAFHKTCIAFIFTLLGWKNPSHPLGVGRGFLGNVTGLLRWRRQRGVKRPSTQYADLAGWLSTLANFAQTKNHSAPSTRFNSTVRTPADMPKPSWNPTLLRLIGPCHELNVFHSSDAGRAVDKYLIHYMSKGPRRLFSDKMSEWLAAFVPGPHASAPLCFFSAV